jgi:beta-galactosidase/beta-glucuronidase
MRRVLLLVGVVLSLSFSALSAPEVPRSEYPQPQFQRDAWLTLDGPWEFEFDDGNVGMDGNWGRGEKRLSKTITVPFAFESRLSGIGDTSFHPWVWYRRTFTVPADWKGQRVLLNFGAVDYRAMVWVNGRLAGSHEGGNVPFAFEITPLLASGANTLVVRAEDPPTDRSVPRGKQYWQPQSRSIWYTRTSGIWQPVWLEAVGESYLRRVQMTTSLDGLLKIDAFIAQPQADLELEAMVTFDKRVVARGSSRVTGPRAVVAVAVAEPRLWSPGSPNLYDVTFELRSGSRVLDRVASYVGFRTVGVQGGRVTLNGNPIFLKMVLDQGYWPDAVLTPPTDEAMQYDIRMTKEMGFNGARKHQKVEDPRWLYWADRLGLLVSGEMANAQVFDADYAARFTREWIEAVERDVNHPSVIIWAPINESWGVPDLTDPRQHQHLKALYSLTKSLDPTRLAIDNEGWEHTEATDLMAIHDYMRDGDGLYERYRRLGEPGVAIPSAGVPVFAPGYAYNNTPIYLSEFGGIAFIPPGHIVPKESWGYSGVEPTAEAALTRLRGLYQAIARVPAFAGLCYTQLTDVEQEVNGLLTFDRKPKFDTKAVREINGLVR